MKQQFLSRLVRKCSKWSLAMAVLAGMAACQNEEARWAECEKTELADVNTEALLTDFAVVLSKATYARKEVREFLKEEAVKEFDKNYDVLYALARDKKVGDETFRDVLVKYSSEEEMDRIKAGLPLLNIYVPEIAFFDINAANMDCEDAEIPVAISKEKVTSLYLNGVCEADLEKGNVPDFHTFVVNENSRVIVTPATKGGKPTVSFIAPEFDGTQKAVATRAGAVTASQVGARAIQAYQYFNQSNSGKYSKALQRDYIYYGLTPENGTGTLQRNFYEYLSFIEVDPKAYFKMVDQNVGEVYDDPYIKEETVSRKKKDFSEEELIDRMWTKGAYELRVEFVIGSEVKNKFVPVKPNEIWNFNYEREYRNGTWFRKKKYTYKLTPDRLEVKRYYLKEDLVIFPVWNLATDPLERVVNFWEVDKGLKLTVKTNHEVTYVTSSKVTDESKNGLGTGENTITTEMTTTSTTKKNDYLEYERIEEDDDLGHADILFYDPIITSKEGNNYVVKTYNTGYIIFGLAVASHY